MFNDDAQTGVSTLSSAMDGYSRMQETRIAELERELQALKDVNQRIQDALPAKQRRKMQILMKNVGKLINVPFFEKDGVLHLVKSIKMTDNYVSSDGKISKQKYAVTLWDGSVKDNIDITEIDVLVKRVPSLALSEERTPAGQVFRIRLEKDCFAGDGVDEVVISSTQL